jgi:cell division protein FtsW (lipid II flippase)
MTTLENKKAFVEILFWFAAGIVLTFLFSFIRYRDMDIPHRLYTSMKGSILFAILMTLLNRLLHLVLKRIN